MESGTSLSIRRMEDRDLQRVVEIDQRSFTLPWSLTSYQFEIRRSRISRCFVAEVEEAGELVIAGMSVAWVVVDEIHIGTIAVDKSYRKRGIGTALMQRIHQQAKQERLKAAHLEVRVSNKKAQNLYQKLGYEVVGIRKGYYADNREDALLMEHRFHEEQV